MNNSKKIEKFQFKRLGKEIEDLRKQICISNEILNDSLNNIFNKFEIYKQTKQYFYLNHLARRALATLYIPISTRTTKIMSLGENLLTLGLGIGNTVMGPKFLGLTFFKN
jgi:hypothetical protein